jgi:hypothetical protein
MKSVVLTLVLVLFGGAAMADDIAIQNPSFEDTNPLNISCGTGCAYNIGGIPDWTTSGGQTGTVTFNSSYYSTPAPDGTVVAYTNGGTISQTLTGVSLLPNSIYTLSVYVGDRLDNEVTDYSFSLDAGSNVLSTFSASNGAITPGTYQQEFVTYTTGSIVTPGDLSIVLGSAGGQADYDDVQLTVVPVQNDGDPGQNDGDPVPTPEPGSFLMLGMGLLGLLAFSLRKQPTA